MLVCSIKITHLFFFNFLFFLVVFFFIKYIVLCGPVALYYAGPKSKIDLTCQKFS